MTGETARVRPGLRERKKQRTRETIARVALQLFAERGYEHTTVAEVADAAEVSKRTIFAYFDGKEDILFGDVPALLEQLRQTLEQRPPGSTTVEALREFLSSGAPIDDNALLRQKIVNADERLRLSKRARFGRVEQLIAESIAKDLQAGPDDIRPLLVAASITAALTRMSDRLATESGEPVSHAQATAILEEVLEFLSGGLEALRRGRGTRRP
jgi:AcrR family transcriptional regulator